MFSDDEYSEDEIENINAANMETYSKMLDEEAAQEQEEAEEELVEGAVQPRAKILPTAEEEEEIKAGPQDLTMVRTQQNIWID
ncbi:unnamed protein product [[Candida] boidinii]|nr:unnamed protein product [[Candida] boidinii]